MYKVILVEDEIVVREAIKRNVDWEANGFIFAGEAPDGELAYALIKEIQPDLIISDIKMPFMDGLELSRLVREEMPEVKIIILTGHSDFEYAQQALRYGVSEYLLKPVSGAELTDVLQSFYKIIREEKDQLAFIEQYRNDMAEVEAFKKKRFFEKWMESKTKLIELLEKANDLSIPLSAKSYNVTLYHIYCDSEPEPLSHMSGQIQKIIEDTLLDENRAVLFDRGTEGSVILIKGDELSNAEEISEQLANQLAALFRAYNLQYFIAVGKQTERLEGVPASFSSANRVFSWRFLSESDQIVFADQTARPYWYPDQNTAISTLDISKIDKTMTERFLRSGDKAQAPLLIKELFNNIGDTGMKSYLLRQYLVMDIYIASSNFLAGLDIDQSLFVQSCGKIEQIVGDLESLEKTRDYLIDIMDNCITLRNEASQKRYDTLLRQAIEYILASYNDDNISLNTVAKIVNVSPTYFSAIFSQGMGITFIEYLTSVRMEKAKELLCCTSNKTSEIAFEVGYNDPHYFSHLFKKINGLTPREFRAKGKVGA